MVAQNVYTFKDVKRLRNKINQDQEITETEKQKLRDYHQRKKQLYQLRKQDWAEKQLMMTEKLIHDIKVNTSG